MKKCVICGREYKSGITGYNMCNKHYKQFKKYNKVLDTNPRTMYDPNEIIEYDNYAEIVLYNRDCIEIARALIDIEDVEKVKDLKWGMLNTGYVYNKANNILLHRFIMNCDNNMVVDHINHNSLDNRKSNLRICTQQQNIMNTSKRCTNTSGVVGVWWNKRYNKWQADIHIEGKKIYLGRFDTKEEAIKVRKQAEIDYFGEYRNKEDEED